MKKFFIPLALLAITAPANAQRAEPQWTPTEVYVNQIKEQFNQCMENYRSAGTPITNGVFLNCLPSGNDVRSVMSGTQPITSMKACVDWSLAYMADIASSDLINQLNASTKCRTEGTGVVSLHQMLGWVVTSEIEPYGI